MIYRFVPCLALVMAVFTGVNSRSHEVTAADNPLARPDNSRSTWIGLRAHGQVNLQTGSFTGLPGVATCCPEFSQALGGGFSIGLNLEYQSLGAFGFRVVSGYSSDKATFTVQELATISQEGVPAQATFEHQLAVRYSTSFVQPTLIYQLESGLRLGLAWRMDYRLAADFEQMETIVRPATIVYQSSGTRTRLSASGRILDFSQMHSALGLTAGYPFYFRERTFKIEPELNLHFGLSALHRSLNWRGHSFGIAVLTAVKL